MGSPSTTWVSVKPPFKNKFCQLQVETADRLSEIDQDIAKVNEYLEKPALLVPSGEEIAQMEQASAAAAEVTNTVLAQKLELDEKKRTVQMLQKALVSIKYLDGTEN